MIDVGDRVIDNVPPFVKDFAIETFGTNDKPALLIGIGVTLLIYAAVIGALSFRRRIEIGLVGIGLFGLIGSLAAGSNRAGGSLDDVVPTIVGSAAGAAALWLVVPDLPTTARWSAVGGRGASERADGRQPAVADRCTESHTS